ncbi:MAG: sigma-70 family RNA polymerase sigma factor [Chitinophagaceae bacterium]
MNLKEIKALNGNTVHPEKWVDTYADYLFGFAMKRLDDSELAKDLVQETFLAALEKNKIFEGRSSEKTWLTGIMKNKIFDTYRRKLKNLPLNETDPFFRENDGHWVVSQRPKPFVPPMEKVLEIKELRQSLEVCIKKLPMAWLVIFTMKHLEDQSSEAICSILNISQSNFWVSIHRAKLHLRSCLQNKWN